MNLANFRDLGGLATTEGRKIKPRRLLRAGEIVKIDDESRSLLKTHDLKKIIDLRSAEELSIRPDDQLNDVNYQWIDIMKAVKEDSSMKNLMQMDDLSYVDRHMKKIYYNLVLNEGCQKGYQEYFHQLLSTDEGGVLFHCFAGKDRTGMAGVFTLEALAVDKKTIYQDYLETNKQRQEPNALYLAELKEKENLTDRQLASVKVAMEVTPSYLDYAYSLINEHFGGMENYLSEVLDLSNDQKSQLKEMYLS